MSRNERSPIPCNQRRWSTTCRRQCGRTEITIVAGLKAKSGSIEEFCHHVDGQSRLRSRFYAEGFSILQHKAEFNLDLHQIAEIWRYGSVVRSWLLDLTADALAKNPTMKGIAPYVADSGEGRWTVAEAIELGVPAPVITLSLLERLRSRDKDSFTDKLLSAMRNQFGGHEIKKE